MPKITAFDIQCQHCEQWQPSEITCPDIESFETNTFLGNMQLCIHCGKFTSCNKENVRLRIEGEDTYHGIDTYFN